MKGFRRTARGGHGAVSDDISLFGTESFDCSGQQRSNSEIRCTHTWDSPRPHERRPVRELTLPDRVFFLGIFKV